jgi:acetylornithine deacetylase/succinyl-diaminopimelate desuccinylase-like protein
VENSCEAVFVSPSNPMVDILKEATGELGISAQISTSFGTSDTRWIVNQGRIPMVAYGGGFLGPDGNLCIHTKDECIKIDDLTMMAKMFALVIIRSCGINQD